jgi:ketosteroid isomerase-like protein
MTVTTPSAQLAEQVALAFVDAINRQNVEAIAKLMTGDHAFIDSLANRIEGAEQVQDGWAGYFRMVPDYKVEVEEIFVNAPVVMIVGTARGTYDAGSGLPAENRWATPAVWRAVIRGSQVAEWRVYADNEPIRKIAARGKAPELRSPKPE